MAELKIISMDEVEIKPVNWLWYPYIPFGKVTIMQGDPGEGKTTIALRIAALLSKGEKLPCDDTEQAPTVVIYQTAEDGLDDTVKPRLIEADADCTMIKVIDESDKALLMLDERIERAIIKENARVLILDPIQAYVGKDVNTAYFENNGGYEYAKAFYAHAYEMAVKEAGGEQFILSAVMHADERNKSLSEELEKDVFHYHLHVVYIPVVEKQILWSKRCKDKSLIGTVKEVITQVSHSKKWSSEKYKDDLGKTNLISSYSKLQDRFFEHMSGAGYQNIERGENLHHTEFKAMKEKERLERIQSKVELEQKSLDEKQVQAEQVAEKLLRDKSALQDVKTKKTALKNVDAITAKSTILDSFKSVKNQLNIGKIMAENQQLKAFKEKVLRFIEKLGLKQQFDKFMRGSTEKER